MYRRKAEETLKELAKGYPIVAITGPRQSGKSTLARAIFPKKTYISLEDPDHQERVAADPRGFLEAFPQGVIIDEVQRVPKLFSYLQTKVDELKSNGFYVLTGSQQFGLMTGISQSLAGRVGLVQLMPFSISELKQSKLLSMGLSEILYKGLYPPLYDQNRKLNSDQWHANYVATYIERDVRKLIRVKDLALFQKFLRMCAARCGQLLNLSSLGADCGISHNTAREWLSVLESSYIVFLLQPHFENFGKRLVKSPKLYFYDTGLAAWLLNIQSPDHLAIHPQRGGLFESLMISELLKARFSQGLASNLYFWRNHVGLEIDVLIDLGTKLNAIEIKSGKTLGSDYFDNLKQWKKIAGTKVGDLALIYGGDLASSQNNINIYPWTKDLSEMGT